MLQLFTVKCNGLEISLLVNVVYDIMIPGQPNVTDPQMYKGNNLFELEKKPWTNFTEIRRLENFS